jgi:hypothetical protein
LDFLPPLLDSRATHMAIALGLLLMGLTWAGSGDRPKLHKMATHALGGLITLAALVLVEMTF